jgi:isocitrate dehydrogenase kinase/phosphatase
MPASSPESNDGSRHAVDYFTLISEADIEAEKIRLTAAWVLQEFDDYYSESRQIPGEAQIAFERRDPGTSLALSKKRLSHYSESVERLGFRLKQCFPMLAENEELWRQVETRYHPLVEDRYAADLAIAFVNSARRKIYQGEWKPVEYGFGSSVEIAEDLTGETFRSFPSGAPVLTDTVMDILDIPGFSTPYRDLAEDAVLVAERVNLTLGLDGIAPDAIKMIEFINAGFYRNRGAYLVGRIILGDAGIVPFIIALLNDEDGIYVDAVLNSEADAHNIFSSTLANFHVTNTYYHELAAFLQSLMPQRPLGLHYSTIGFNHVGKVAVMNELKEELSTTGEHLKTAVGFRGTVAIGFSSASSAYNLKVIRDKPTAQYKWGEFEGIPSVLKKYGRVHEINRTGSMLDNIIYYNLKLDREWFDPELLDELLREASESVSLLEEAVVLKYLIVQRRMTPLPVFLETASAEDAETAIINLGYCIKNNAAANIFNKDLDARNYGVSRFVKVYLYDYDALEPFTEVKIRSNQDREEGEEDIPDWFFEKGVVFLPEEIEVGLQIPSRSLRRLFREVHGDLLSTAYWERIQNDLREGRVPGIRIYPQSRELNRASLV